MKNKKVILISISFILVLTIIIVYTNKEENTSLEDDTTKEVLQENTLSMMIEQTAGAGDYKLETRSSWPTSGYTFNTTLSKCENGSTLSWDSTKGIVTMTGNVSDKCYVYFDIKPLSVISDVCSGGEKLTTCITTLSNKSTPDLTSIYYHNGKLTNGISDGSYRYAGASDSVNNYVCFGSNEETCPTDNLYRIIGVFGDQVKLIKKSKANNMLGEDGDYVLTEDGGAQFYWNYKATNSATNTWSTSLLNTTNLNTNFINKIGSTWSNKIASTTWKVGGNTSSKISSVVAAIAFQNEITNPAESTTYPAKIGLMYVSDYGFAADPSAWTTTLYNYSGSVNGSTISSLNWMHQDSDEWTISRCADDSSNVFRISWTGYVYYESASYMSGWYSVIVRPVFYLNSSITYASGTGSSTDPIRIN